MDQMTSRPLFQHQPFCDSLVLLSSVFYRWKSRPRFIFRLNHWGKTVFQWLESSKTKHFIHLIFGMGEDWMLVFN